GRGARRAGLCGLQRRDVGRDGNPAPAYVGGALADFGCRPRQALALRRGGLERDLEEPLAGAAAHWRYAPGLWPVLRLKSFEKCAGCSKPRANAISLTVSREPSRRSLAFSTKKSATWSRVLLPVSLRKRSLR